MDRRRRRYAAVFVILAALLLLVFLLNVMIGNVSIPVSRVIELLLQGQGGGNDASILWKIRLPRALMAMLLGGSLALSGFLLQTFFENPIAGPFVLGISSGAKLAVAAVMIIFLKRLGSISSFVMIAAAFAGALAATGFILAVARVIRNMAALLVAGIMIGYICSALTEFVITFAEDSDIVNLHGWSQGSFSGMNWNHVASASLIVAVTLILTLLLSKPISAYLLGENYARSVGVNVRRFRIALILLSSLLSACVTAFAGPISFVGIAVPFLIKQALGTSKPLPVIPATFLGGAVFCLVCDLIAKMAFAPTELNISTVTSVFGAPIVIFMLIRRQKGRER